VFDAVQFTLSISADSTHLFGSCTVTKWLYDDDDDDDDLFIQSFQWE